MQNAQSAYVEMLRSKKVIIVCPSKSLELSSQYDFIEGHDLIVRLNNGYAVPTALQSDFGKRTDVLYHYLGLQSENQNDYDLEKIQDVGTNIIVIPPRPEILNFQIFLERNQNIRLPFLKIAEKDKKEMWDKIGSLAFCGVWAVFHLLKFPLRSLQVIGMDFFNTGHYSGHNSRTQQEQISYALNSQFDKRGIEKQHHIHPQKVLIRKLFQSDPRLILDEITWNAIDTPNK